MAKAFYEDANGAVTSVNVAFGDIYISYEGIVRLELLPQGKPAFRITVPATTLILPPDPNGKPPK